jgi:two-component system, OmpR family, sensor histidine kinase TctE
VPDRSRRPQSIRRRLLSFLIPALLLLVGCAAVLSYVLALHAATTAYDRSLLDPALGMAQNVRLGANGSQLEMLAQEQEALLYDHEDTLVFQIRDAAGNVIAGIPDLPPAPPLEPGQRAFFFDATYNGKPLRIAAVRAATGSTVQVGETLNKRRRLVREILAAEFLPTVLIALASLALAWTVVTHGIAPLGRVRSQILARSPHDLRPIDDRHAPLEIAPAIEAFNHLLSQLRDSNAVQQRFLTNAAHQLRTPLAALQMHLELLLRRELPGEVRHEIESMHGATTRATRLANQLLILAKAEASGEQARPKSLVSLRMLVDAAVHEWVPRAIAREIDLGFDLADASVWGDAVLLTESLNNLIDNALRYTPPGGSATVRCGIRSTESYFSVEDSGPGIPVWAHERVFERFFRIQGTLGEGAGLGLAIVREVAEQHAARAVIENPAGSGTRVTVVFPAVAPEVSRR